MPEKKVISVINNFDEQSGDFRQVFTEALLKFLKSESKQKQTVIRHREDKPNV